MLDGDVVEIEEANRDSLRRDRADGAQDFDCFVEALPATLDWNSARGIVGQDWRRCRLPSPCAVRQVVERRERFRNHQRVAQVRGRTLGRVSMREVRDASSESVATNVEFGRRREQVIGEPYESRPQSSARSATRAMVSAGGIPTAKVRIRRRFYLFHRGRSLVCAADLMK